MLEALMPNNDEFYFATVYEDRQDKKGEQIQYELLTEMRRSYGQVINNLISEQGRKVIKSHDYEFKTGNIVVDEDGVKWYVQEAVQFKENINVFSLNFHQIYIRFSGFKHSSSGTMNLPFSRTLTSSNHISPPPYSGV